MMLLREDCIIYMILSINLPTKELRVEWTLRVGAWLEGERHWVGVFADFVVIL